MRDKAAICRPTIQGLDPFFVMFRDGFLWKQKKQVGRHTECSELYLSHVLWRETAALHWTERAGREERKTCHLFAYMLVCFLMITINKIHLSAKQLKKWDFCWNTNIFSQGPRLLLRHIFSECFLLLWHVCDSKHNTVLLTRLQTTALTYQCAVWFCPVDALAGGQKLC